MLRMLKLLVGGLLVSQVVYAQPPAAPTPVAPQQADLGVRGRASLSPQEMLAQSREHKQRIAATIAKIDEQITQARTQKDVIKVNCLTDKIVQARAHRDIVDQAIGNLEQAVGRADEGATMHEYTRVTIVNQKMQVLTAEADQCVGEDLSYVGATQVNVDVDPGIRQDDPTQPAPPLLDPVGAVPDSQSPST